MIAVSASPDVALAAHLIFQVGSQRFEQSPTSGTRRILANYRDTFNWLYWQQVINLLQAIRNLGRHKTLKYDFNLS